MEEGAGGTGEEGSSGGWGGRQADRGREGQGGLPGDEKQGGGTVWLSSVLNQQ